MKNVCDIYYEKELFYIVGDKYIEQEVSVEAIKSSAVVVNLYYADTLGKYLEYLRNVPDEIDIYIFSSNNVMLGDDGLKDFSLERNNVKLVGKENRGRDVSALLVAFQELVEKYEYICFIHDKKPNFDYLKEDIDFWIYNLWNNTLKSETYIKNVLGILEKGNIGMLVPPNPLGNHMDNWYRNAWYENLQNTKELAEKLMVVSDISPDKSLLALGTVFWAKAKALQKLFDIRWRYEDFPEEPMPLDGTVSHAIERVLPYVVQDAGYETGVIVSRDYAEKLIIKVQKMMTDSFAVLWKRFRIGNVSHLTHYEEQEKNTEDIFRKCRDVYLYGAGNYGQLFLELLESWGYRPKGFVVTDGRRKELTVAGYPVYELHEISADEKVGFIICTNYNLQDEIEESLLKKGFNQYFKVILS